MEMKGENYSKEGLCTFQCAEVILILFSLWYINSILSTYLAKENDFTYYHGIPRARVLSAPSSIFCKHLC